MKYRKNIFDYIGWLLAAIIITLLTVLYGSLLVDEYGCNNQLVKFLPILLIIIAYIVISAIGKKANAIINHIAGAKYLELILFIAIIGGGLFYRGYLMSMNSFMVLRDSTFFEMAQISKEVVVGDPLDNASAIYIQLLSFMMRFLGNREVAVITLQILIQDITLFFLYFSVRKILGFLPAIITSITFSYSVQYIDKVRDAKPECLYFLLFTIAVWGISVFCNRMRIHFSKAGFSIGCALLGAYIGVLLYIDFLALLLIVLWIGLFYIELREEATKTTCRYMAIALCTVAFFFVSSLFADAMISARHMSDVFHELCLKSLQVSDVRTNFSLLGGTTRELWECFLLVSFAWWIIPGFFKTIDKSCVIFIYILLLISTPIVGYGTMQKTVYSLWIYAILAGIGMSKGIMSSPYAVQQICEDKVIDPNNELDANLLEKSATIILQENLVPIDEVVEASELEDEDILQELAGKEVLQELEVKDASEIRYIPNPLPLPKKPKHKAMEFDYSLSDDELEFDYEISDDDDFDFE